MSTGLPQLELQPASGPVGTYVTISGQFSPEQVSTFRTDFGKFYELMTNVQADCATGSTCSIGPASLAGCELVVGLGHPVVNLDTATGDVTGSFTVGGTGTCHQGQPTLRPQAAPPGEYSLAIGCNVCFFAEFRVTAGTS